MRSFLEYEAVTRGWGMLSQACWGIKLVTSAKVTPGQGSPLGLQQQSYRARDGCCRVGKETPCAQQHLWKLCTLPDCCSGVVLVLALVKMPRSSLLGHYWPGAGHAQDMQGHCCLPGTACSGRLFPKGQQDWEPSSMLEQLQGQRRAGRHFTALTRRRPASLFLLHSSTICLLTPIFTS